MSMTERSATVSDTAPDYVLRDSDDFRQLISERTAAFGAAFLLPHLRPGMSLLDCGCGPGSITLDLAKVVAPGEVVGVDVNPAEIDAARQAAVKREIVNARFDVADIYALPFPDASFDAAYANTVLQHLDDPPQALREMRRVLRPGGIVGIQDPDWATLLRTPSMPLLDLFPQFVARSFKQPYYARNLRHLLLQAGFVRAEAGAIAAAAGTLDRTLYWVRQDLILLRDAVSKRALEEGWADQATLDQMRVEIEAWSRRADAFLAILICNAIGWVAGATDV
jgi:ubiquinone/menaquinone biosynthesis C-methylase UbiE